MNHKRVERLWRQEGLKVPAKQPKRGRLWLNDGSCLRLKPEFPDPVWSYDFMPERTHDGRPFRILNVIDEFTRECLAVKVARQLDHEDVQACLTELELPPKKWTEGKDKIHLIRRQSDGRAQGKTEVHTGIQAGGDPAVRE